MLRSARLDGTRVSDAGARALTEVCADLEMLSLRGCARVTDATALAALVSCANLRHLLLGGTAAAGDRLRGLMQQGKGKLWPDGVAATSLRRLELPQRALVGVCWPPGLSVSAG